MWGLVLKIQIAFIILLIEKWEIFIGRNVCIGEIDK